MSNLYSLQSRQQMFDFAPRPKMKLSEIERIIRKMRIIVPCPCRQTLVNMCEDGTFEAVFSSFGYLVFEDSFWNWARELEGIKQAA